MNDLTHDGITQPISEWAADYGIPCHLIRYRLKQGWSVERAITQPMNVGRGRKLMRSDMRDKPDARPVRLLTFNGETLTIAEWADRLGVRRALLDSRLARGWTAEQTISGNGPERHRFNLPKSPERRIAFNGETLTLGEWAIRLGLTKHALHQRFRDGWPLDRALTVERQRDGQGPLPRLITFNGETLTLHEWADRLGIDPTTIIVRLNRAKWPLERALTTGNVRGQRRIKAANDDRHLDATA